MKPTAKSLLWFSAALAALYVISFPFVFQLLSYPVRNNQAGWLGPQKRSDPQTIDIGKVYYYESTDLGAYSVYRPLCVIWLWLNGFS
jgi:hypothetical protein